MAHAQTSPSGRIRVSLVQFLARQQATLRGYAYAICGDHHVADDAVQELSLIVAADPERFLDGSEDAARWLRAVLRNKTLELSRKAGRQRRCLNTDVIDVLARTADDDTDAVERHQRMRLAMSACVSTLDGDARRVVEARYCDNLPCEAIATQIQRTVQAVYAVLKRVRLTLADCVQARLASSGDQP